MSKRWTGIAVIPCLALGLALAGCTGDTTDTGNAPGTVGNTGDMGNTADANTPGEPGDERDADQVAADVAITGQVKSALLASTEVGALEIDVDTVSGVVSLNGEVDTEEQKAKAEEIAKGVEGVTSVTNNLTVEPDDAAGNAAGNSPH
ncbi:MAG: BON domain-containing protein [Armatimonadota bacterium]